MQKCRGERTISEVGKAAGDGGYYRHETLGYLPKDPKKVQKIADALGCSVEKLTAFTKFKKKTAFDILPIFKAISESSCERLTMEEFDFLLNVQKSLPAPMTPQLVKELLTNRRTSETKDSKNEDWLMPAFEVFSPTPEELFWEAFTVERDAAYSDGLGNHDAAAAMRMRAEALLQQAIDLKSSYGR